MCAVDDSARNDRSTTIKHKHPCLDNDGTIVHGDPVLVDGSYFCATCGDDQHDPDDGDTEFIVHAGNVHLGPDEYDDAGDVVYTGERCDDSRCWCNDDDS